MQREQKQRGQDRLRRVTPCFMGPKSGCTLQVLAGSKQQHLCAPRHTSMQNTVSWLGVTAVVLTVCELAGLRAGVVQPLYALCWCGAVFTELLQDGSD
jgi:hypothetical protein